jgi:plasmid stability protein
MPERTSVYLPEDLIRQAERKAAAEGRSVEDGLRRVLSEREPAGRRRRVLPSVSASGGGLAGIDLDDSTALQEMDDLIFARRLE